MAMLVTPEWFNWRMLGDQRDLLASLYLNTYRELSAFTAILVFN